MPAAGVTVRGDCFPQDVDDPGAEIVELTLVESGR